MFGFKKISYQLFAVNLLSYWLLSYQLKESRFNMKNNNNHSAIKKLYVGIDISKDKFDVSYTVNGQDVFGYSAHVNNEKGIKTFLKQSEQIMKKHKCNVIHFCMEATGIYHCGLCEYLQNYSDHIVSVVNPVRTKSFSKSLMLRTKNDKVDSNMLTLYTFFHNPEQTPKMPENIKKFKVMSLSNRGTRLALSEKDEGLSNLKLSL